MPVKKITYIANARIPTEKAHGIQIMKMCEAFTRAGVSIELIVPRRLNPIKQDPFEYYGMEERFTITRIPCIDLVKFGRFGFLIQSLTFSISAFFYTIFKKADIIYSRDEAPLFFLSFFKGNIVFEGHVDRLNFAIKKVLKKSKKIIAITHGLKDFYIETGINSRKILVSPDGVDLKQFNISDDKKECREKLQLPKDKKIITYTGHLYDWKGAQVLADVAKQLKGNELVVFVGGTEEDIKMFKKKNEYLKNIFIVGHRNHQEIPIWLKSADVLVLPNTGNIDISRLYTSPMKLFEYMASGVPIIASDLPSIREVLNEQNAILAQSGDSESFTVGIQKVLNDKECASVISNQAFLDVKENTWDKRAGNIIDFIK